MTSEPFQLATPGAPLEDTRALLRGEAGGRRPILLGHGAGVPMDAPFLVHVAEGLAAGGHPVLTFNYAYAERMRREDKRRPPDRRPGLEAVHRAALAWLEERFPGPAPVLAGKSLGGRISSYLAAEGEGSGLLLYGYPLHPAGKPERTRSEHFPALAQPALFLQGTRDALCEPALLEKHLESYGGDARLEWIQEADHDFKVPKRTGFGREEILNRLVELSLSWLGSIGF